VQSLLAAGGAADAAWCQSIDAHIQDFDSSGDDYFRHRAADLRDMRARVLAVLAGEAASAGLQLPPDAIVLADDLAPTRFLATRWLPHHAVLLRGSSPTAHVALLARSRSVPMVVGLGDEAIEPGSTAIVDGATGTVDLQPDEAALTRFAHRQGQARIEIERGARAAMAPAFTADGERVQVLINVASLDDLAHADPALCDGIGLVRTELLFAEGPPDEDAQLAFYRRLLQWAGPRPVVVRTLDAGGDKPMPGITVPNETHPFLGQRGLRLSLRQPWLFKPQLRALLRAAAEGQLRVMVPMVTDAKEMAEVRAVLQACIDELRHEGRPYRVPPLGVMVEVPAAALALESLGDIAFASIGSNDLLQYTMAAARDNPAVSALADPAHPGFVRLLRLVASGAAAAGVPLSLCGDLAAQPAQMPLLLAAGLRSLSMPAPAVGAVKLAIAAWPPAGMDTPAR